MEAVIILIVLAIFIALINTGSYLRRINETMKEILNQLKKNNK